MNGILIKVSIAVHVLTKCNLNLHLWVTWADKIIFLFVVSGDNWHQMLPLKSRRPYHISCHLNMGHICNDSFQTLYEPCKTHFICLGRHFCRPPQKYFRFNEEETLKGKQKKRVNWSKERGHGVWKEGRWGGNYCERVRVSSSLNPSWERKPRALPSMVVCVCWLCAAKCRREYVAVQLHAWYYVCLVTSWGHNWASD